MGEIVQLPRPRPSHPGEDTIWAVMAAVGKIERIADVYPTRVAALADRAWREQQVRAYAALLRATPQAIPRYSVAPIRRADLPRRWTPLPALGFLLGQFG
jgi:hypothetical protein